MVAFVARRLLLVPVPSGSVVERESWRKARELVDGWRVGDKRTKGTL